MLVDETLGRVDVPVTLSVPASAIEVVAVIFVAFKNVVEAPAPKNCSTLHITEDAEVT